MSRGDRGAALLEALVALTILALAGSGLIMALSAGLDSERAIRSREMELSAADQVLAAMTLLSRGDLDRRLGRHPIGELLVEVQRPEPRLYRIGVADSVAAEVELLVTVVFRPDPVSR